MSRSRRIAFKNDFAGSSNLIFSCWTSFIAFSMSPNRSTFFDCRRRSAIDNSFSVAGLEPGPGPVEHPWWQHTDDNGQSNEPTSMHLKLLSNSAEHIVMDTFMHCVRL